MTGEQLDCARNGQFMAFRPFSRVASTGFSVDHLPNGSNREAGGGKLKRNLGQPSPMAGVPVCALYLTLHPHSVLASGGIATWDSRGMWLTLNAAYGIASDQEFLIGRDNVGMQAGVLAAYFPL